MTKSDKDITYKKTKLEADMLDEFFKCKNTQQTIRKANSAVY